MEYYQVWLAVHPDHQLARLPESHDAPVKRPCGPPYGKDPDADERLGACNVQNPTPTFFVDDPEIWGLLSKRAMEKKCSVAEVISAAVSAHVKPQGPVLSD